MRTRRIAPIALVTAVLLLASGCAGTGGTKSAGDSFVYAITEPDHLTPGRQAAAFAPVLALFAPLVSVDARGRVTGVQAESVTSTDGRTWKVVLRRGWSFSNGEPVTSHSYVDAWNATAYGPNAWVNAGQLAAVEGFAALNPAKGKPSTKTLSGLHVVDDRTFTVRLSGADSSFPQQLTAGQTAFYPMPKAAFTDPGSYDRRPVGNGPYEMTAARQDDTEFTVRRSPRYGGTRASTARIVFRPYADPDTAYTDVLAGNADLLFLPPDKYAIAQQDFGRRLRALDAPAIDFIGFPPGDRRFRDKRVRQAISMAIDRRAVNKAIYGDLYRPATALTPPAQAGTPKDVCGRLCRYDPAAARALLKQAGGFTGSMRLVYPGGAGFDELYQAYANLIRQNLRIKEVVAAPTTDFAEYSTTLADGKVLGPHYGHWGALYPSQQNTLRALFTKTGGCALCTGGYANPEVDRLLAAADAAKGQQEATGYYVRTQQRVMQDFPVVPTFFDRYVYVTSERLANLPSNAGSPVVERVRLTR